MGKTTTELYTITAASVTPFRHERWESLIRVEPSRQDVRHEQQQQLHGQKKLLSERL